MAELAELVADRDTIVVIGPGGVGKTTTSASIAFHAARQGRKVLVLTVDPARRLATALGLDALGGNEARVSPAHFARAGCRWVAAAALYAMMLDTKSTFDALCIGTHPALKSPDAILENRFYKQASTTLAGSQEYMAMEKLYELREERDYDLIVLDTPPAVNAADFFEAPERMTGFLDSGSLSFLLSGMRRAGRFGFGLFNSLLARVMNRFVGARTFMDILNFVEAFSGMFAGFKERADRVAEMLRAPTTGFVIVSSTEAVSLEEAVSLRGHLKNQHMPFGALLINGVREPHLAAPDLEGLSQRFFEALERSAEADPSTMKATAERLEAACRDYAILAEVDAERVADVSERFGADGSKIWRVPLFQNDVHDIASLSAFADHVFSS